MTNIHLTKMIETYRNQSIVQIKYLKYHFILSNLSSNLKWIREFCGGHWEKRFGTNRWNKTYFVWYQFSKCTPSAEWPNVDCEDYGPVKYKHKHYHITR